MKTEALVAANEPATYPRGLCWPSVPVWTAFFKYAALIQVLWLVVYGGADWLTSLHVYRVRLHFDWELAIPFEPVAALVYWSLLPLMWLSPLVLGSVELLGKFMRALAVVVCICGVGFILLPSEPAYAAVDVTGPFSAVFLFADKANLAYNMCPSLHVAMATLAALSYSGRLNPCGTSLIWLWVAAIAASTLLCHQHHLVDVIAGGIVGWSVGRYSYFGS